MLFRSYDVSSIVGQAPYVLSVNTLAPHKNLITLLRAYRIIKDQIDENLVLVGLRGHNAEQIAAYVRDNGLSDRVLLTGYISEEELQGLYVKAGLFVTTSLYEGFGMSPVEAIGSCTPTISTRATSLPEVTQELAHYYEPATDEQALAATMREVLLLRESIEGLAWKAQKVRDMYAPKTIACEYWNYFQTFS